LFFQGSDQKRIGCHAAAQSFETLIEEANHHYSQGRSQDFSKGGAEVMEAKALKRKNCL